MPHYGLWASLRQKCKPHTTYSFRRKLWPQPCLSPLEQREGTHSRVHTTVSLSIHQRYHAVHMNTYSCNTTAVKTVDEATL